MLRCERAMERGVSETEGAEGPSSGKFQIAS